MSEIIEPEIVTITPLYDDKNLLLQLHDGDETAFSRLYDQYWSSLYSYAYNRLRSKEHCQDIVQEVFMDIWRRRKTLEIDNLAAYLHSAVRFATYKEIKKLPLDHIYYQEFEGTLISSFYADIALKDQEHQQLLSCWIDALPPKRKKIFLLYYLEELSTEDIAKELNISRKTVQNQIQRAKMEMQLKYAHYLASLTFLATLLK